MSGKNASIITIIALLISLVPWLVISFYTHPQYDDYLIAVLLKDRSLWEHLQLTYMNWSGRYFATLIPALLLHGEYNLSYYQIFPLIWLAFNFFLIYSFINRHWANGSYGLAIALVIFYLQLSMLPSPATSIYWLTGALAYFLPWLLTLAFWNQVLWKMPESTSGKVGWHILNLFLLAAVAGSNELSLYVMFCTLAAYIFVLKGVQKLIPQHFYYYFAFYLLAAGIMMAAPGNYHRMNLLPDSLRLGLSAIESIKTTLFFLWIQLRSPLFWTGIILFFTLLAKKRPSFPVLAAWFHRTPIGASLILSLVFIYGFYLLSWLILGSLVIDRQHNIIALAFWPVVLVHLYGLLIKWDNHIPDLIKHPGAQVSIVIFMLWFSISDFYFQPGERPLRFHNSSSQIWFEWLSGDAAAYSRQYNDFYQLIKTQNTEPTDTLLLPALVTKPSTLYVEELSPLPDDFHNTYFARYWKINNVKVIFEEETDD